MILDHEQSPVAPVAAGLDDSMQARALMAVARCEVCLRGGADEALQLYALAFNLVRTLKSTGATREPVD
jgi:hypothetical protein